jgi:hypothetical protein
MSSDIANQFKELGDNLHTLFDGYAVSFDLRRDQDIDQMWSVGSAGPVQTTLGPAMYTLVVEVALHRDGITKSLYLSSMDMMRKATISEQYRPKRVEQRQTLDPTRPVPIFTFTLEYYFLDLDDFIVELKKHAWREYSAGMTELIDQKLSE